MSASQSYGKVLNTKSAFVQKSDNPEVLKIFRNTSDGKWYTKDYLGNITPFPPAQPATLPYRCYRTFLFQSKQYNPVSCGLDGTFQPPLQDDINGTWVRDDIGVYKYTKIGEFSDVSKIDVIISNMDTIFVEEYIEKCKGQDLFVIAQLNDQDSITLKTGIISTFESPSIITLSDDILRKHRIEIRINN